MDTWESPTRSYGIIGDQRSIPTQEQYNNRTSKLNEESPAILDNEARNRDNGWCNLHFLVVSVNAVMIVIGVLVFCMFFFLAND